jgi:hypothetical protein
MPSPPTSSSPSIRTRTLTGQLAAVGRELRLQRLHVDPQLALVVDRPARVEVAVALGRFEGRRLPFVERVWRLHIVVSVKQHRRRGLPVNSGRRMEIVRVDQRMAVARRNDPGLGLRSCASRRLGRRCLDQPHVLHADAAQLGGNELGGAAGVGGVFGIGRDGRNAQQGFQLFNETRCIVLSEHYCGFGHFDVSTPSGRTARPVEPQRTTHQYMEHCSCGIANHDKKARRSLK